MEKLTEEVKVFSGWKDIANYLGKGVRTVQRYERELELPVHRPSGSVSGSVLAVKDELDGWIAANATRKVVPSRELELHSSVIRDQFKSRVAEFGRLQEECVERQRLMAESRSNLRESLALLRKNLRPRVA